MAGENTGTYEKNAGKYAERWAGYPFVRELDEVARKANASVKILELGCGVGQNCNYLKEKGFDVVGVDLSEEILKEARKRFPGVGFWKSDARKLCVDSNSFDAVFAIGLFHHLNAEEQKQTVSEIKRVLKKNGVAFVAAKTSKESAEKQLVELKKLFEENGFAISSAYADEKNMASEEHKQKFANVLAKASG